MRQLRPTRTGMFLVSLGALFACSGADQILGSTPGDGGPGDFGGGPQDCVNGPDFTDCPCDIGETIPCYTGPAGTQSVGLCKDGVQTCEYINEVSGAFGKCTGDTLPSSEQCDGLDHACTGSIKDCGVEECGGPATAPRLIGPLSTARATHQRPNLTWVVDGPNDGAHIQICKDKACTQVLQTFDAKGTSGAPAADLPAGALYWRAFGTSAGQIGCDPSGAWELFVGPRSAPVNTSWGSVLDIDADGYADAVFGGSGSFFYETAPNNGGTEQVTVFRGGPSGLSTAPITTLTGPNRGFGNAVADAGDVNGDGYADVLVATSETATHLFLGGPAGLATSPAATLPYGDQADAGGAGGASWRYTLAGAGDVNGDGYADVVVGVPSAGVVHVFLGSPSGLPTVPAATISAGDVGLTGGDGFAVTIAGAGDVNGDGYGDVIIGAAASGNPVDLPLRQAYVFHGSASGLGTAPASKPTVPKGGAFFGMLVMGAGDVDGDGYTDVLVQGAPDGSSGYTSAAYLFRGGAAGISEAPTVALTLVADEATWYGVGKAAVDLDGDGYSDVAVGAEWSGKVYVHMGGPTGLAPDPAVTISDGTPGYFSGSMSGADVDGDGFGDLAVVNGGSVFLYPGSAGGIVTTPTALSTGGGYSAFHASLGSP